MPGGTGNFSVVVAVHSAFECVGCSVESIILFCWSPSQFSSMFLYMGQFGPHPHFSICFRVMVAQGIAASWACGSTFIVGVEVGVGELASPSLIQKYFLQAMECLLRLGYLQVVGVCQLRNLLEVGSLGIFLFLNSS